MPEIRELVHLHVKEDSIAAAKLHVLILGRNISYREYMSELLAKAMEDAFTEYYEHLEMVESKSHAR